MRNSHIEGYLGWLSERLPIDNPDLKKARRHYDRFCKSALRQHQFRAWGAIHRAAASVGKTKGVRV